MEFERGTVVKVKAGHDADRFCVVLEEKDGFCWVADGKYRKLNAPKKKNPRHLAPTAAQLDLEKVVTDRELRRQLSRFGGDHDEEVTHEGGK